MLWTDVKVESKVFFLLFKSGEFWSIWHWFRMVANERFALSLTGWF